MTSIPTQERVALHKLWWVAPLTIVVAILANSLIRLIAVTFFGVSETFQYMQMSYIIGSTILFSLLALLAFVLVGRSARRPMQFYRKLALVFLGISLLSPIMALSGLMPTSGMTLSIFFTMIAMHIVSAAIVITLFTTLARE